MDKHPLDVEIGAGTPGLAPGREPPAPAAKTGRSSVRSDTAPPLFRAEPRSPLQGAFGSGASRSVASPQGALRSTAIARSLRALRRRWPLLVTVLGAAFVGYGLVRPVAVMRLYETRARVELPPSFPVAALTLPAVGERPEDAAAEEVAWRSGPRARVKLDPHSNELIVHAFGAAPSGLARLALDTALDLGERALDHERTRLAERRTRLASLRSELEDSEARILARMRSALEAHRADPGAREAGGPAEMAAFEVEVARVRKELATLAPREVELATDANELDAASSRLAGLAPEPLRGVRLPGRFPSLGAVLTLAALLGLAAVLGLERLDARLYVPEEVERSLRLPVLQVVPTLRAGRDGAPAAGASQAAAARFEDLAVKLLREHQEQSVSSIAFVAPRRQEGTTFVVLNAALALARAGTRVVIVDASRGSRGLEESLLGRVGEPPSRGLRELIEECLTHADPHRPEAVARALEESLDAFLRPTSMAGVTLLPAGSAREPFRKPEEIAAVIRPLLLRLGRSSDLVLCDADALELSGISLLVAAAADATVLTLRCRHSERAEATQAKDSLTRSQATLLGAVLNGHDEAWPFPATRVDTATSVGTATSIDFHARSNAADRAGATDRAKAAPAGGGAAASASSGAGGAPITLRNL